MSHQAGVRAMLEAAYRTRPRKRPTLKAQAIPRLPKTAESLYVKALRGVVKKIGEATREILGPEVDALAASERTDAAGDMVTGPILDRLKERIAEIVGEAAVTGIVTTALEGTNRKNLGEMSRVLGIAPEALIPGMGDVMDAWRRANVDLIKSIGEQYLEQVQEMVTTATTEGIRAEALSRALQERLGVAESRAELIARDQILKANAQLSSERMRRVGVTRYKWSTSQDSRVRPDHAALEGEVFRFDDPPVVDQRTGRKAHPGDDFQCLPGHAPIHRVDGGVLRAFRRPLAGQKLVSISTSKGLHVEVTPNHPVLTGSGWKPAHALQVGDDVFDVLGDRALRRHEDEQHRVPTIEQVFETADVLGFRELTHAPGVQFHGDMIDGDVDVVYVDRSLWIDAVSAFGKERTERLLADADAAATGLCAGYAPFVTLGLPADRIVGGVGEALAFLSSRLRHSGEHRGAPAPEWYARALEVVRECLAFDAVAVGDGFQADPVAEVELARFLARVIAGAILDGVDAPPSDPLDHLHADRLLACADDRGDLRERAALIAERDRVVDLRLCDSSCAHVFNLETATSWYGSTIALHNCRCVRIPQWDDED